LDIGATLQAPLSPIKGEGSANSFALGSLGDLAKPWHVCTVLPIVQELSCLTMTSPVAFLSYAHRDDAYGGITALREALGHAIGQATGDDFEIFQDRKDIAWGEHWPSKLEQGLAGGRFLIAILSPSFLNSDYCRKELTEFLAIEQSSGRNDLILPIYYRTTPLLENPTRRDTDPLAKVISQRQYADWRELRHLAVTDPKVRRKLDSLAEELVQALERSEETTATPPGRAFEMPASETAPFMTEGLAEDFPTDPEAFVQEARGAGLMEPESPFISDARTGFPEPGSTFRDIHEPWCPEMVVIPAGSFVMGSPPDEEGHEEDEEPEHRVRIARPFALGVFPVTFEQFDHFCVETGRRKPGDAGWGRGLRPVINVNVEDAEAYLAWLSGITGQSYCLPSEAMWEYACRAGTTTPFWTGATITTDQANYDDNHPYGDAEKGRYRQRTTELGEFPANPFGLCDMHGNVWEWCADPLHKNYEGAPSDGSVWLEGGGAERVPRGGSWHYNARFLRSARRYAHTPGYRYDAIGFRCARVQA
jgi:formylglycine-generating enzyme required for sulfatase activity